MLRQARERLPAQKFIEANIAHWAAPDKTDVLFANAIFQWVPGHLKQLQRLLGALPQGGVLAVQMPDNLDEPVHVLLREVAKSGPWRQQLAEKARARDELPTPGGYYDALSPLCSRLDVWHTIYNHVLDDAGGVVEWVKGTGMRPFVDPLEPPERKQYVAEYTKRIAEAYLPQADGKVLLRFPRIFIVAVK
jgi:trans-aconitate 2-methyltransferase